MRCCVIWSLRFEEERELKVFENSAPDLYRSPSTAVKVGSRRIRWVGHLSRMRAVRNEYRILVKKPLGIPSGS